MCEKDTMVLKGFLHTPLQKALETDSLANAAMHIRSRVSFIINQKFREFTISWDSQVF